jgi:FkbH-like protein
MKVLIISDITLETLNRNQLLYSKNIYSFIFSEDLLYQLENIENIENYDIIYIHFDCYFKKHRSDYISMLLNSVLYLSNKTQKIIAMSNLFFGGWLEKSLFDSGGAIRESVINFEPQIELLLQKSNVYVFDIDSLIRGVGVSQTYNYSIGHLYQLPYTKVFLDNFAKYLDQVILKISSPDKKVIILDCDNTLWKGIVGEDGLNGIVCDLNSDGIVFYHFQQFLKSRKAMGFLLCLCSKNNEEDVKQVFYNKRMPLQWDDFVVRKVNWNNKDLNIKEIANELNLGEDSFVFIDDNEFEINIVKQGLSEVSVFKMTTNYHDFIKLTEDLVFSKKTITNDDLVKTKQYTTEAKRKELQQSSVSLSDYIETLEIVMIIDEVLESDLMRVSQLTEKTNQFNFNKRYYSVDHLKEGISNGLLKCYTLKVSDKFGDYGLVGLILIELASGKITLENYILSCRILGRRIEFDFFEKVNNTIHETFKKNIEEIRFNRTDRNIPAQNFYNHIKQKI